MNGIGVACTKCVTNLAEFEVSSMRSLTLLLVVITLYIGQSNGGELRGSHVCSKSYYQTTYVQYRTWTTRYRDYYSKCGWFGWSRCKRSRAYRSYYYDTRTKAVLVTYYVCCSGWRRSGSYCSTPICSSGCSHGYCSSPDYCSCYSGWRGYRCQSDINECSSSNGRCQQICTNTAGSYRCGCNSGYTKSSTTTCKDYNECNNSPCKCASDTNACGATCTNTPGSYTCSCAKGFQLEANIVCKDIDECSTSHNHVCAHTCVNTIGSYNCICRPGYLSSQHGTHCTDIDECQIGNGECEHSCQNIPGSRLCSCRKGYRLDASNKRTCADINECQENSPCQHQCTNLAGSFVCSCHPGYKLNYDKSTCSDINECTFNIAHCEHTCTNSKGSYKCGCKPGYKLYTDERSCKDVDECTLGSHQCSHVCINTVGGYQCRCVAGYELKEDGRSCKAIPCETLQSPSYGSMLCSGMATNDNCSFACNHGYNMEGSSTMTCMTTSRWSASRPICKAKECGQLTPSSHVVLSLPCYRTYGSSCDMRCSFGFYSTGNSKVTCDLNEDKARVSWKNDFHCHHVEACKPNPCRHGGRCVVISSKTFKCDCSNTGFKGRLCEEGVIELSLFPKLKANLQSPSILVHAKPPKEIQITIQSDDYIVSKPRTIKVTNSKTQSKFTLTSKQPGLKTVSFSIRGENRKDFRHPQDRVLFTSPQTPNKKNIYADIPILPGELPTGCHTIKTDMFKCNVQLSSTLLWKRNRVNKQASTQGIVHLVTGNGKTAIPLSLVGAASTSFSNTDVLNNIKRINKMKKNVRLETDTTCLDAIIEVPQLMELVENDAFASSFMNMISKSTPPWLQLHKKTKSENFDLSNIHATIGSKSKFSSSLLNSSNLVIYEPSIGPTISLGEDNMSLDDTKGFCYAIDVCTSDVSISLPRASVKALTSSPFLQDMKTAGWEIEPKGIAFTGITRRSVILESQWNGRNMVHQKTQDYKFAIEGKMKSKLKNKRGVKVSLEYEGDVYVDTVNVTEVFHYGFERETTAVFKGKASLNMTTTVFNKKVTIAFPVDEVFGTSTLGGDSTHQGLYFRWKRIHDPFLGTPYASMVRAAKNQPLFVAIEHQILGGRQTGIVNINGYGVKMTLISLLLSQMRNILSDSQVIAVMQQESLKRWTNHINEAEAIIKDLRALMQSHISDSNIIIFSLKNSKLKDHVRNVKHLCTVIESTMNTSPRATTMATQVKQLRSNLPLLPDVNSKRSTVIQDFKGFKIRFHGMICVQRICFPNMAVTLDSSHTNKVSSKPSIDPGVTIRGESSTDLQLGKILILKRQNEVNLQFPSGEGRSTLTFKPSITIMGVEKTVSAEISNDILTFQTSGLLFGKYEALMSVSVKLDTADWSLLQYHVKGKMDKNSGLPKWFERKTNNYILENAEKATKRVKNAESVDREATNKLLRFKKTIEEVFKTQQMYEREKQTTSNKLKLAKKEYFLLKIQLHDILLPASNDKQTCRPKQCKKECSRTKICTFENKRLEINEPKYHCEEYKTHVERIEKKKRTAPDFYWKKTFKVIYTGNCHDNPFNSKLSYAMGMVGGVIGAIGDGIGGGGMGAGGLIGYAVGRLVGAVLDALGKGLFGCDNTYKSVPGPPIKITYTKVWYEDAIVKVPVTKLTCTSSLVKKVTRSFETPKLTCKQDTCIKIMDPTCIKENNNCIKQHRLLQSNRQMSELEIEKTKNLVRLNHLANKMEIASNELERINAKRIKASEELKMARAQLKHLEYAKTRSVNGVREVEEFQSTKFGLKLSRLLEQTPDKKVVRVSDFTFDVTTSESDKKEIPLYLTVSSTDGKTKELRFLFDFGKDEISLHKMTTTAVNTLYQEVNDKRRKRRSISDELFDTIEKTNNTENLKTLDNHDRCLMAKKANLFYRDIVKSLELLIHDREDVEKSNMADIRQLTSLYQKFENISRDGPSVNKENDTDNSDEMIKSYVDLISSLMNDKQNYSLMSWNQSLISWRAFLEVLTNERSFADCASVQDCVFAVGDDLDELYFYESDFPRANEMREMLSNVTNDVLELITRNFTVEEFMYKISMLDQLLNQTVDTNVLCGKIPEITFNSEESRVVLENDTFVLECAAKSDTPVTYEWIHKNVSIHRSTNGSLTISHANTSHAGAYQCNAINRKGAVTSNVTVIAINSKPKITQQPNDTKVYINDDVGLLLTCNATGVPFPTIDWFFVSQRPNSSIINLNNDNGTFLYYQQMTDNDSGYYFCTATNKHGQVKSTKAKVWVLDISPGEPRLGVKVNMTKRCKRQEGCYRHTIDGSKELNQYSLLLSKSMNSSESQIIDIKYAAGSAGQGNSTVSFIYRSTKPQKQDVNEPVFDPILESFARKRTHLVNGLKTLYQQMKNGSLSVTNDDDEEVSGDPESLIAWIVPPGCPRGQEPHSNGYMCALCSPGTYGKVDGRCEPCPVKTYQYQAGQTKRCFSCEYGFSTKQIGSSSPDDCHDMRPSPPRHLQATAVGSTRLEVKWLKPEENSDSILYYWMKYGQLRQRQRQRLRTKHVPKTTTTWSLARLRKFTDYRIMVYAVNWYGMTKSQIIIVQTGEDIPDAAPFITRTIPINHNSVRITWRPIPEYQRNGIIQGFHIYYSEHSRDNEWNLYTTLTGNITTCVVPGLKPLTWYCFKMSAYTSKGQYPRWKKTSCRMLKTPSPPVKVTGRALGTTEIMLRFRTTNGQSRTNVVYYGDNVAKLNKVKRCRFSSCFIYDLKEDTVYHFKVLRLAIEIGETAKVIQVRTLKKGLP